MISNKGCQLSPSAGGLLAVMKAVWLSCNCMMMYYDFTLYTLHCICHEYAITYKTQSAQTVLLSVLLPVLVPAFKLS